MTVSKQVTDKVSVSFMQNVVQENDCVSVRIEEFSNQGGYNCDMFLLHTDHKKDDGSVVSKTRVLKMFLSEEKLTQSKNMGLAREGCFLNEFLCAHNGRISAPVELARFLPGIDYAMGNMETGEKLMIMEKLKGTQAGLLFEDNFHPMMWSKSSEELQTIKNNTAPRITQYDVMAASFRIAAQLHSSCWMNADGMKDWDWLHSHALVTGNHPEDWISPIWQASQDIAVDSWRKFKSEVIDTQDKDPHFVYFNDMDFPDVKAKMAYSDVKCVKVDPHLQRCIEASIGKINFKDFQQKFVAPREGMEVSDGEYDPNTPYPWSIIHGDFFPGNVFCNSCEAESGSCPENFGDCFKLLDFEMIGIGFGPQDLGQYMISNCSPAMRRKYERQLVRDVYYNELVCGIKRNHKGETTPIIPSCDQVWEEYKIGGVCRWIWFLCLMLPKYNPHFTQFFCDSLSAFLEDHFPGDDGLRLIGMPRV